MLLTRLCRLTIHQCFVGYVHGIHPVQGFFVYVSDQCLRSATVSVVAGYVVQGRPPLRDYRVTLDSGELVKDWSPLVDPKQQPGIGDMK